jgi:hypothetical protein
MTHSTPLMANHAAFMKKPPKPSELALPCSSLAHGACYVPKWHRTGAHPAALSRAGNGFAVTSEALGFILRRHEDVPQHFRYDLCAQECGELCMRAGEQGSLHPRMT